MTDVFLDLNSELPPVSHLRNRPPWWGGDLQTLANKFVFREKPKFAHSQNMEFPVRDGSGDTMTGTLHDLGKGGPLVILVHGVAGSEDSTYVLQTAGYLLELRKGSAQQALTATISTERNRNGFYT